ncbi:MAG: PKD domain-containing protein [Planctomycetota bacterium]
MATVNQSPALNAPSAGANPVTGTETTLGVTAVDDGGEGELVYSWSVESAPNEAGAWFSVNGTNAAKNTTVFFGAAGDYIFRITATDARGESAYRTLNVTVEQTLTELFVTPADAALLQGETCKFDAIGIDQFGNRITTQVAVNWSVTSGGGSINSSGLYTAPTEGGEATYTITAGSGDHSGTANVAVYERPLAPGYHIDVHPATPLQCIHGCATESNGAEDITVVLYAPAVVESLVVYGKLICPDGDGQTLGPGTYRVGTLKLYKDGGGMESLDLVLEGTFQPRDGSCGSETQGEENVGDYVVFVFTSPVQLDTYGGNRNGDAASIAKMG